MAVLSCSPIRHRRGSELDLCLIDTATSTMLLPLIKLSLDTAIFKSTFVASGKSRHIRFVKAMLNKPRDFVGNILAMMLSEQIKDERTRNRIHTWKMSVILATNYYPILIDFNRGVTITREVVDNPTLCISMSFDTMIALIRSESTIVREVLTGSIRIKGFLRHPLAAFRFYGLMKDMLGV